MDCGRACSSRPRAANPMWLVCSSLIRPRASGPRADRRASQDSRGARRRRQVRTTRRRPGRLLSRQHPRLKARPPRRPRSRSPPATSSAAIVIAASHSEGAGRPTGGPTIDTSRVAESLEGLAAWTPAQSPTSSTRPNPSVLRSWFVRPVQARRTTSAPASSCEIRAQSKPITPGAPFVPRDFQGIEHARR